jgi:hypothetical protein
MLCLQQNWRTRGQNRFFPEVAQTMYIHINKCKNDKIREGKGRNGGKRKGKEGKEERGEKGK